MSRDWKKDKELLKHALENDDYVNAEIPMYWLQQYAAEKERRDIAELAYQGLAESAVTRGEYQSLLDKHTAMTKAYRAEKERADKIEEREKVLKHAFIVMLGYVPKTARVALDFDEVLASLYPKEETKP